MADVTSNKQNKDLFAQIGAEHVQLRDEMLYEPQPPELPDIQLPALKSDPGAAFKPQPKLDTAAKLTRELDRQRRIYSKFLKDLSPDLEQTRAAVPIEEFDWRIQTESDLADFTWTLSGSGEWERVGIPHFGGPLGRATAYYRTTFDLNEELLGKGAVFICFKGVDYKAHVFINNSYLGSHEGFFAPFEFDFTRIARSGENTIAVVVENDAICMGNESWNEDGEDGKNYEGDKLYAASGTGYDEPVTGWHHCPPGMGIYQNVYVEARAPIHVTDIFVRAIPEDSNAECWIEVNSCHLTGQEIRLELSVYGRNFRQTVISSRVYEPSGEAGPGINYYRLPFDIPKPRLWDLSTPWLYQAQVKVLDEDGNLLDASSRQFGVRSFRMDEVSEPKGRFYLNGRELRLRGANTMGFEQQDVMKGDWDQLIDDILLAKICHMNFWRLTQRPVQPEVYDYCDRLGLMTQTDLPLFAVLRRNQFSEAVRQAGEMEHLIRSHPCNIMVTYINEPFPNGWDKPHRHLTRPELESFFIAANETVRLMNPERVIKPVDGDYDPPAPGLPDAHCYTGWYNGHGVDLGKLHRGYWQKVKPGWFYACGEFGAEGLDSADLMRRRYPASWLPQTSEEEKDWTPDCIPKAQTGRFHYMWFDTQHTLEDWAKAGQSHQAWVTSLMTGAFRRDSRMNSFAIHLFIDAFPSGWMKTIMDVERRPKPAYFAYRDALTPLMANLRTDRYTFFSGESVDIEVWLCNDLDAIPESAYLHYQVGVDGEVVFSQRAPASIPACGSEFQGYLRLDVPVVKVRTPAIVRLGLVGEDGIVLHDTSVETEIFPSPGKIGKSRAFVIGSRDGKAARLTRDLGLGVAFSGEIRSGDVVVIDDCMQFVEKSELVMKAVERGSTAVFLELTEGKHQIAGDVIEVAPCGMNARHFVSRSTGHPLVADFQKNDFKFWHDPKRGYEIPLLATTFTGEGWTPILTSGNGAWLGGWKPSLAVAEKRHGKGVLRICQVELPDRTRTNPVALFFARKLLDVG